MSRRGTYTGGDSRTRQARAQGYPARSVFKLQEIDERWGLLRSGGKVLDLGAAPGSWSLYAAARVTEQGSVLAVDLQEIGQAFPPWVRAHQADAFDLDETLHAQYGPYDAVLSDMAPRTTGDKFTNAARSADLLRAAHAVALKHGRPGSHFVAKLFMGADFESCRNLVQQTYQTTKLVKPKGTRDNSVEIFVVGIGKRGSSEHS